MPDTSNLLQFLQVLAVSMRNFTAAQPQLDSALDEAQKLYDAGVEAGKAMNPGDGSGEPSDKIYSQADVDSMMEEKNSMIESLNADVASSVEKLSAIKSMWEKSQSDESVLESEFGKLFE